MRRTPIALAAVVAVAIAACGGDDDDAASTTIDDTVTDVSLVPVTSVPGSVPEVAAPEVSLPDAIPTELGITTLTPGSGPEAAEGDTVYVNYVGVRSEDGQEFDSNFGGDPYPVTLGEGGVIAGWDQGLVGSTAGERRQLDIPNDLAYGDQPRGEVIQAGDALTFVIDVQAVVPATDPADAPVTSELPLSSELTEEATVEDLRVGEGATLEEGDTGIFHLVAARVDDGTELQSTWTGAPQAVPVVDDGTLIDELITGLPGMQVGGRRLIRVPHNPESGLTPETDLYLVVDLIAIL
jgi:peptidylprolyl isomerase